MKVFHILFVFLYLSYSASAQMTGKVLLDKTINFHDPKGNWSKLNQRFLLRTESVSVEPVCLMARLRLHIGVVEKWLEV